MEQDRDFQREVLGELATLNVQMKGLMGNGQAGRVRQLELRLDRTESLLQRIAGIGAAVGILLTLMQVAFDYIRTHH